MKAVESKAAPTSRRIGNLRPRLKRAEVLTKGVFEEEGDLAKVAALMG